MTHACCYTYSDETLKKNVVPLQGGLEKIMALHPKRYSMKVEEYKSQVNLATGDQFGLLAQEVQAVFPEVVSEVNLPVHLTAAEREANVQKPDLNIKAVNYGAFIPVLLAAIQEQQAQINELRARLSERQTGN